MTKLFTQTLRYLNKGSLDAEIGAALAAVSLACRDTGKAGAVTIKLALKAGKSGALDIDADVTTKAPKPERGTTLMFVDDDGDLTRSHPDQAEIPGLREVAAKETPMRSVGGA